MNNLIGIDIGGTKCAVIFGSVDKHERYEIKERIAFATKDYPTPEGAIGQFIQIIHAMLAKRGMKAEELSGIGISCGGPLNHKLGVIQSPPNLLGWDDVPIVQRLSEEFAVPTYLQNDANACALAEWKLGAARGCDNAVFLTFGTGLGAGLILGGRLYTGADDMAGEVGHVRMTETGPVGYGKAGSFEGYCSGGGIAQLAKLKVLERLQRGEQPKLCPSYEKLHELTARTVAEAAKAGDPLAAEIYEDCGQVLGRGLAMLIDLLNPQVIVLGSIFARSGELLTKAMNEVIEREALELSRRGCRIVPARLGDEIGDYAALTVAMHGGEA